MNAKAHRIEKCDNTFTFTHNAYDMRLLRSDDVISVYEPKRGYARHYTVGTICGTACRDGRNPIEEYNRVIENQKLYPYGGHSTEWINANSVVIHDGPREAEPVRTYVGIGQYVRLEGYAYRIDAAPNDNLKLTRVGKVVGAMVTSLV